MKTPSVLLLAAACLAPLSLQARDDLSTHMDPVALTDGHQELAGQSRFNGGSGSGTGVKAGKKAVEIVPEPRVAAVLGILGAIVLLRRRA